LLIDVEPEDAFTLLNNLLKGGAINHKQTSVSPGFGFWRLFNILFMINWTRFLKSRQDKSYLKC